MKKRGGEGTLELKIPGNCRWKLKLQRKRLPANENAIKLTTKAMAMAIPMAKVSWKVE